MESLIPNKTLEDLEYIEVLNQCANFAITQLGKDAIQKLQPSVDTEQIEKQLKSVSEFKSSFDNENRIPNHGFESLLDIFPLLKIENSECTIIMLHLRNFNGFFDFIYLSIKYKFLNTTLLNFNSSRQSPVLIPSIISTANGPNICWCCKPTITIALCSGLPSHISKIGYISRIALRYHTVCHTPINTHNMPKLPCVNASFDGEEWCWWTVSCSM